LRRGGEAGGIPVLADGFAGEEGKLLGGGRLGSAPNDMEAEGGAAVFGEDREQRTGGRGERVDGEQEWGREWSGEGGEGFLLDWGEARAGGAGGEKENEEGEASHAWRRASNSWR